MIQIRWTVRTCFTFLELGFVVAFVARGNEPNLLMTSGPMPSAKVDLPDKSARPDNKRKVEPAATRDQHHARGMALRAADLIQGRRNTVLFISSAEYKASSDHPAFCRIPRSPLKRRQIFSSTRRDAPPSHRTWSLCPAKQKARPRAQR